MKLLKKNLVFYKQNGYIKVTNFFSHTDVKVLKNFVDKVSLLKPKKGQQMIYYDKIKNFSLLTRTENFLKYDKKFRNFFIKKKLNNLVDQILGKKSILFKDKINWKYPKADGFKPHQDAQVWDFLYPKIKSFISLAITVDATNAKNGCLEVVSKMHKKGLLGDNKSAINKKISQKMLWEKIITKPGDLIFFDSYTPHRSGKNLSKLPRKVVYLTYNAKKDGNLKEKYFTDKRVSFPPNNERIKGKKYKYLI